jgi:CDP-paratose 2-epimerase
MNVVLITGAAGLVGSEAVRFFSARDFHVVGIDNDMRKTFFGEDASTQWNRQNLEETIPNYAHHNIDIREEAAINKLFADYGNDISVVIHTAAQPSHDWAAQAPLIDFTVNANGTLVMLEATRAHCPDAAFIFTSTNKVYGDAPNSLPLVEQDTRWEIETSHPFYKHGIDESMSIDQTKHSLFGVSKLAADTLVQEYGRYFEMKTGCFRGGCITGPDHSGTMLHGFLSYLVKCAITETPYTILGYKGKQVRDNIHAHDLVNMFWNYTQNPRPGEVYNAGGGRHSNCSILEAVAICEQLSGKSMNISYREDARIGDHIWYVSDTRKFQVHYPDWHYQFNLQQIIKQIYDNMSQRLDCSGNPT